MKMKEDNIKNKKEREPMEKAKNQTKKIVAINMNLEKNIYLINLI